MTRSTCITGGGVSLPSEGDADRSRSISIEAIHQRERNALGEQFAVSHLYKSADGKGILTIKHLRHAE
ncbi:hypothetical protein SAMN05414139_09831 [Burkholderia sp. D7]|nr:hypothetical protein SAMN05414139_09831 [Burkholderia sp. D7]